MKPFTVFVFNIMFVVATTKRHDGGGRGLEDIVHLPQFSLSGKYFVALSFMFRR